VKKETRHKLLTPKIEVQQSLLIAWIFRRYEREVMNSSMPTNLITRMESIHSLKAQTTKLTQGRRDNLCRSVSIKEMRFIAFPNRKY